jgi:hypothetical protein
MQFVSLESHAQTPYEMVLIEWLAKVTNDPVVQGAATNHFIGVGSYEDRWNGVSRIQ